MPSVVIVSLSLGESKICSAAHQQVCTKHDSCLFSQFELMGEVQSLSKFSPPLCTPNSYVRRGMGDQMGEGRRKGGGGGGGGGEGGLWRVVKR